MSLNLNPALHTCHTRAKAEIGSFICMFLRIAFIWDPFIQVVQHCHLSTESRLGSWWYSQEKHAHRLFSKSLPSYWLWALKTCCRKAVSQFLYKRLTVWLRRSSAGKASHSSRGLAGPSLYTCRATWNLRVCLGKGCRCRQQITGKPFSCEIYFTSFFQQLPSPFYLYCREIYVSRAPLKIFHLDFPRTAINAVAFHAAQLLKFKSLMGTPACLILPANSIVLFFLPWKISRMSQVEIQILKLFRAKSLFAQL